MNENEKEMNFLYLNVNAYNKFQENSNNVKTYQNKYNTKQFNK